MDEIQQGQSTSVILSEKKIIEGAKRLSSQLKMQIDDLAFFSDGFSFTVEEELSAYKAAYHYRYCQKVIVNHLMSGRWLVQIWSGGKTGWWHPASEQPEDDTEYILADSDGEFIVTTLGDEVAEGRWGTDILWWMPIPEK